MKSTFLVNQEEVKLADSSQHKLIQKISNLIGTGEDNVSYKLAMDRLNRKLLEEVGTQKSREKPINIITKKMEELQKEKENLEEYKDTKYEIDENIQDAKNEIEKLENKLLIAYELKKLNDKLIIENEKIKIEEKLEKENNEKINKLNQEKN